MVVVISLICFTGCTVTQSLTRPQAVDARPELQHGDWVVVELKDGRRFRVMVVQVTSEHLVTQKNRFPWELIDHIEYKSDEVSIRQTLWGLAGTVVALAYVGALVASYLFFRAVEDD